MQFTRAPIMGVIFIFSKRCLCGNMWPQSKFGKFLIFTDYVTQNKKVRINFSMLDSNRYSMWYPFLKMIVEMPEAFSVSNRKVGYFSIELGVFQGAFPGPANRIMH